MDPLQKLFHKAFEKKATSVYKPRFSASSFPYCARREWIYKTFPKDQLPLDSWDYYSEFYSTQGTAIHEAIQKTLGTAGLLYGDWRCCCKNTGPIYIRGQLGVPNCPSCTHAMEYVELELSKDMFGMGGYVDGVIPEYEAVLEIKTKGAYQISSMTEPLLIEWGYQASSYVTAVNRQYGLNLKNVIMLYVSRDNPRNWKIYQKKALLNVLDEQIKSRKEGEAMIISGIEPEFLCPDYDVAKEFHCVYAPVCFATDAKIEKLPKGKRL